MGRASAAGALGRHGEELAAEHLAQRDYRILARNWRADPVRDGVRGEADLVAEHDGWLVVVEVKTRSSFRYGHPFESITPPKAVRLHRLAVAWARLHDRDPRLIRVDAVAVTALPGTPPCIEVLTRIH
ncbi:YraN family protein [Kocuria rosea]|uniref:YraN family protein n=1 Tax=Kocuria rosea TaxID=1275 RepID=UPI0020416BE3|nr:YraN family protein [Kocuria rosea]MCM3686666.1 YraN family protein [Kocuria rosea]